jgi:subtilisin family serine protease
VKSHLLSAVAAAGLLLGVQSAEAAPPTTTGYIVVLTDNAIDPGVVAARYGLKPDRAYRSALNGFAAQVPPGKLAALSADRQVRYVDQDRVLDLNTQTTPTGVQRIGAAPSSATAGSVNVDVAIVDTGIDPTHPDLNVVGGYNCTSKDTTAWADDAGHGTAMAGVVAAKNNDVGVVGVAPGARLWAVKIGGPKGAKTSDVICGLDWLAQHAGTIKVASLSLSGKGSDDGACGTKHHDALHQAVCRTTAAGVTTVVSAGNATADFAGSVPAAYDEVLTVTAMADYNGQPGGGAAATCLADVDDTAGDFSNFTTPTSADASHTIAAPGVCIASTAMGGGYTTVSGTSPAAPHVAATVARCLASGACAGRTPRQIIAKVRADAAARPTSYGFVGDPSSPLTVAGVTRYYGNLAYAGAY